MKTMLRFYRICFFVLLAGISAGPAFGAEAGALRIGTAKVDMTPADVTGLTNQWRGALTGVHDSIFVRALVLDNGKETAAIVAADWVEFGDTMELRERIAKETGIPAGHQIISATHNHQAPRPDFGEATTSGASAPQAFTLKVYEKVADAVRQAKASLQPARIGSGRGEIDVNINREAYTEAGWHVGPNPDRQSDKTVSVVKFETPFGDPIALLFNYAVHSNTGGPTTDLVTGDLAGAAERYVEAHYNDTVVALFTIGAGGDQNPRFIGPGEAQQEAVPAFQAIEAQGLMLGAEVVRVAGGIRNMTGTARIAAGERTFSCPTREKPQRSQGPAPGQQSDENRQTPPPGASEPRPASMDIHLGLIMVNQIAFTSVSGEVVTNIYRHLKKDSPLSDTIMITLANGRVGYIADDAAYDTPTFSVNDTPLARGYAENGIVDNLVEMIRQNQ